MPRVTVAFGREYIELEVPERSLVPVRRGVFAPALANIPEATRHALDEPLGFPPLRQAVTPDDHLVVAVQEELGHLPDLIPPILEHLLAVNVRLENITLVCPPRFANTPAPTWSDALPGALRDVPIQVHDPADARQRSYLASTRAGRRVYLNRTLVDADQAVVLGRIGYDPILGFGGGLGGLFPALSDEATRQEFAAKPSDAVPGRKIRPAWQEAQEVGWLLGMPFLVQVIGGQGDDLSHILGGAAEPVMTAGCRLLDQQWRVQVERAGELVVAAISGDPHMTAVTRALANAARVVRPGGKIVVLSRAGPPLGPGLEALRQTDSPAQGLALARQLKAPDAVSVWELATASEHAQLYLLSQLPALTTEELFLIPLETAAQTQRLIDAADSCVVLADADRTLAVVEG